jgi:hypothetical protein
VGAEETVLANLLRKSSPRKGESQWETRLTTKPR